MLCMHIFLISITKIITAYTKNIFQEITYGIVQIDQNEDVLMIMSFLQSCCILTVYLFPNPNFPINSNLHYLNNEAIQLLI